MLILHGSSNSCDAAILVNNKANCTVICSVPDPWGPGGGFIISKVQVDDLVYVLPRAMTSLILTTNLSDR